MTEITLNTPGWGGYLAGAVLDVLKDGEDPRPQAVDRRRADQLVADRLAVPGRVEATARKARKAVENPNG